MKKKKAILVTIELTTRIPVDEDFDIDNIGMKEANILSDKCVPKYKEKLQIEGVAEHASQIEEDTECPAGTFDDDEES